MTLRTHTRQAAAVTLAASLLFLLDLFLDWQRAAVHVADIVDVEGTSIGWNGWGFAAGIFALLLVVAGVEELRGRTIAVRHPFSVGLLPLGLLSATALAVFTGDANVDVASGTVGVEVDSALWPAWTGLALAIVAATAAFAWIASSVGARPTGIVRQSPA